MKYIVVTGGAGFIGTNLIRSLLKSKGYKIISIDNYFTGKKSNHIKAKDLIYLRGNTKNISKILDHIKNQISVVFHFAEFSRIAQSFENINHCFL